MSRIMDDNYEAYENLANAIILQAVKYFRASYRRLKRLPKSKGAKADIEEITEFFQSEFFSVLTDLDGPSLRRKIIKYLEEETACSDAGRDEGRR